MVAVLPDAVGIVLACAFVFQFGGDYRKTVEKDTEVEFVPLVSLVKRITHLSYHRKAVGKVKLMQSGILAGKCRLGLHQFYGNALYLQPFAQNINQRMTVVELRVVILYYCVESGIIAFETLYHPCPCISLRP